MSVLFLGPERSSISKETGFCMLGSPAGEILILWCGGGAGAGDGSP